MYIISPITVFDEDKELFETHIGLDNPEMTLLLSAWGRTYDESRQWATGIVKRLNLAIDERERQPNNKKYRQYPLTEKGMTNELPKT